MEAQANPPRFLIYTHADPTITIMTWEELLVNKKEKQVSRPNTGCFRFPDNEFHP
jgi:hypothetical protein